MPTNNNNRSRAQQRSRHRGQGGNSSNSNIIKPLSSPTCPTRTNMKRCQEMMECRDEITMLQKKLHDMRQQQERMGRLAALQACCDSFSCSSSGSGSGGSSYSMNPSMRAAYLWSQCSKEERWKKPVVLALLKACPSFTQQFSTSSDRTRLPAPLRLHKWDKKVPRHLRQDRDVVLARLQRADLFVGIPSSTTTTPVLTIPPRLQKDLSVVLATIRRYPDILFVSSPSETSSSTNSKSSITKQKQQHQQPVNLLELHADSHVEMFRAVLEAFRYHHEDSAVTPSSSSNISTNNNKNSTSHTIMMTTTRERQDFLDLFSSESIRGNRNVMMQVWKEWVLSSSSSFKQDDIRSILVTETLLAPSLRDDKAFALQLAEAAASDGGGDDDSLKEDTFPGMALCALSKRLRQDKEVVMAFVARNGHNIRFVEGGLDKTWQVVKTAMLRSPSVVGGLSNHVKKRFHWNKSIMLQLFRRIHEVNSNSNKPSCRSSTTPISYMTAEMEVVQVVWNVCPPKLCQDKDVFMAALRAGAGMQQLTVSFYDDWTSKDAAASTSSIKNKSGMQQQNRNSNNNNNNTIQRDLCIDLLASGRLSWAIPKFLVEQRDLWIDLIASGHLSWNNLPKHYRRDKEFAIACLLHGQKKQQPTEARQQQQQLRKHEGESSSSSSSCPCCATYRHLDRKTVQTILEYCPAVATDRRMVVSWIRHYHAAGCTCPLGNFFFSTATASPVVMSRQVICPCLDNYLETLQPSIRRDKSIMLEACRINPAVILYLPVPLQEDRDVVECVLLHSSFSPASPPSSSSLGSPSSRRKQQSPVLSLQYISAMAQHLYPDLIAQAIRQLPKSTSSCGYDDDDDMEERSGYADSSLWDVFDDIDEDLWAHREVALAWVERGGAYLQDDFPEDFENDAELFLEIASSPNNWDDFMFASETLLTDKDFMAKAVTRNGHVLREAKNGLDRDYDLALLAFANTENLVDHYNWTCPDAVFSTASRGPAKNGDFEFLVDFARKVRAELLSHESFIEFLMCVQLSAPAKPTATRSDSHDSSRRRRGGTGSRRHRGSGGDKHGNEVGSGRDGGCDDPYNRHPQEKQQQQPSAQVHLLAQGAETTSGFTKLVAEFMGIPIGERLRLLRQASVNLARWGF